MTRAGTEVCTIMGSMMERMLSCAPGFINSFFFMLTLKRWANISKA